MKRRWLVSRVFPLLAALLSAAAAQAGGDVFQDWDAVEKLVRASAIPKAQAQSRLLALHPALLAAAPRDAARSTHYFPVQGYGPRDIGGRNGSGYAAAGYNYYDGKNHRGHPAHDIFILDRNRDSRDDRTGKPVVVRSFGDGVVVALSREWDPHSDLRGGKVVWVFDRVEDSFYCYAHLSEVSVDLGRRVRAGDVLGTVGRTGANAAPARSPTHLHFMSLAFDNGRLSPRDTYQELLRAIQTK